jgi:lysyl-tRNA synthetase class 1
MSGKDLITSVELSTKIFRVLSNDRPPQSLTYELFLDANGEKISKSKGNGLTVEEWLRYAPEESLALYMFQQPRRAKRLHFDVIPKAVDEYLSYLGKFPGETPAARLENPVWHIHDGAPPAFDVPVSFGLLLNLASVAHAEDDAVLWGFISRYKPGTTKESSPLLARLVGYTLNYYRDFVRPAKHYRAPTEIERAAFTELADALARLPADADAETFQTEVYEVGKRHEFAELRDWFKALYEVLFGQSQGPRMGSFIALYGRAETIDLIRRALAGELAPVPAE